MKKIPFLFILLFATVTLFSQDNNVSDTSARKELTKPCSIKTVDSESGKPEESKESLSEWVAYFQILASFCTAISLPFLFYQLLQLKKANRSSAKANKAEIVVGLFNEFRDEKWQKVRQLIAEKKEGTDFKDVVNYCHLLNHFGFLLEHKYVDIESIYETMGLSVMYAWKVLSPQIIERRKQSDNPLEYYPYQYHFEYLDYRIRQYFPQGKKHIDELMKKMNPLEQLEVPSVQNKTENNQL